MQLHRCVAESCTSVEPATKLNTDVFTVQSALALRVTRPLFTCVIYILAMLFSAATAHAQDTENERVVLQLKWEHEFQFAGYYAALWKGFYEREGLDVEIRSLSTPEGLLRSPIEELTSGRADFTIGGTDVFVYKGKGHDIKVLAPIFQRSPAALFSLPDQPLNSVHQASKLRIATASSDSTELDARAMFYMSGFDINRIEFVDAPVNVDSLMADKADAIMTYGVSARTQAREQGLTLNSLNPSDYNIPFYGDILYTTSQFAKEHPDLVEKFLRATLEGWRYAMSHRNEIAEKITATLPRYVYKYEDFGAYNQAFAQVIDEYTLTPYVELGHIDESRWQEIYDTLERLGEIQTPYNPAQLIDKPKRILAFSDTFIKASIATLLIWMALYSALNSASSRMWAATVLFLMLFIEQGFELWHRNDIRAKQAIETTESLYTIRSNLEQSLARNLAELSSVAAYIAANPDLTQKEFELYAQTILALDPQLINLAAAPDLVVKYVYPHQGNEAIIGLDYTRNAQQRPAVLKAIETSQPVMAGPVDLLQGGKAFIGRTPIRIIDQDGEVKIWGIVSAPIDVTHVYRQAGLLNPDLDVRVSIRGQDSSGAGGNTFYGHQELFNHPDAITQTIHFGHGSWQIAAISIANPSAHIVRLFIIRIASALVAFLLILLIIARRRNLKNQQHYQTVLRHHTEFLREVETVAKVGGWRMDRSGKISELSEQARTLLNLNAESAELTIEQAVMHLHAPSGVNIADEFRQALIKNSSIDFEVQSKEHNIWFRLIADPVMDQHHQPEMIGAIQDITEKKITHEQLEYQANYDNLTGLPNRALFQDRLELAMTQAKRSNTIIAVLFVDLDNFKDINDNYGHSQGDLVLQEAARRICNCLRASDTVARHSGDEFTVIISNIKDDFVAEKITQNIITALDQSFEIQGADIHCGASIGITLYPGDADTHGELIVNADRAMYEVKKSGRNGWHFYTNEIQRKSEHRHNLYNRLVVALRDNEIDAYLQPIFCAQTHAVISCEALARWQQQDGTWITPDEFIPLAEETGLVNQIDYLITTRALNTLSTINQHRTNPVGLSVNVSPRLFHTKDNALNHWMELIKASCNNQPLSIEITERLLFDDFEENTKTLYTLADMGVGISIDDFGTGYSSLSYLTRFPVTTLKIDRSFVNGIGTDSTKESVIETILVMAKKLDIRVVAEGVETKAQADYLKILGCDYLQGYYLGRPMPAEDFIKIATES